MKYNPEIPYNNLPHLPGDFDFNTPVLLKRAMAASESLARLSASIRLIPNAEIIMMPLMTRESVQSNAIENINTTTIKALQYEALGIDNMKSSAEKEVLHYRSALSRAYKTLQKNGFIHTNLLLDIQGQIEPNKIGIRKVPGVVIANSKKEVIYTPPSGKDILSTLLSNLEQFINTSNDDIHPLIKIGVIHYQFESIHPFLDGNGRVGRILMVLYLCMTGKLESPVLFLSGYIYNNRQKYYQVLRHTTETGDYTEIILFTLDAIQSQSDETIAKIHTISDMMNQIQEEIDSELPLISHKLTNMVVSHPFLIIGVVQEELGVSRQTASVYLRSLNKAGVLEVMKSGKSFLYYHTGFLDILS